MSFSAYDSYMRIKALLLALFVIVFFFFSVRIGVQAVAINVAVPYREENDLLLKNTSETVCTQDVKQCPDGSYVSRQPPTCVFAPCSQLKDKRDEFKEKLQIIRDEKKKALVVRIDERIEKLNKNYVARFSESIKKLEAIFSRLKEKTAMLSASGTNVSMANNAIANAQTAIDSAKISLAEQEAKVYNIEVSSETGLKANVGRTVSQFRKDLRDVHKKVMDAKQAVRNVEKELAKIRKEGQE